MEMSVPRGFRADQSIINRQKEEDRMREACAYDNKMKNLGIYSGWFEKNQKFAVENNEKRNEQRIKEELMFTYQEIKMRRRIRLRELYLAEYNRYEDELNKMGLSVVKERS